MGINPNVTISAFMGLTADYIVEAGDVLTNCTVESPTAVPTGEVTTTMPATLCCQPG